MKEGIRWEGPKQALRTHPFRDTRYVPTARLMQRLDIVRYDSHPGMIDGFVPEVVRVALKQHIGAPATCVVAVGDKVKKGDLIGEIPDKALGARVHASIDGKIEFISDGMVTIRA